jgi:hypothetical protein
MTVDEANKLITQRRYRCRQLRDSYVLECAVDGAKVTINSDEIDAQHPIWRVNAELNNPGPQGAAVKSISDQFNAHPTKDAREEWIWTVGRGLKLTYDGSALKLVDEAEDIRRGKEEAKRGSATPGCSSVTEPVDGPYRHPRSQHHHDRNGYHQGIFQWVLRRRERTFEVKVRQHCLHGHSDQGNQLG